MAEWALIFLVVVILVLRPIAQKQREKAIAERLKKTRDPIEAGLIMDNAIRTNRSEGNLFQRVADFFLFLQ